MNNFRNLVMLGILAIFFAWYGLSWAYESLYREPRKRLGAEIKKLEEEIAFGKQNVTTMTQGYNQLVGFYMRSLPRTPNDARSLYTFWLLELLKYCDIEAGDVTGNNPTRAAFGLNYRFNVRGTCSLDRLSRLLFEFYYAPFLHRVTSMTIAPVEGKEDVITVTLTVDALALRPPFQQAPYPLQNQLPTGYIPRLRSNDLTAYHVIADRNLLQAAKGGVDKADYAYLTAINQVDDQTEIWLTVRTDNGIIKAKKGEAIRVGSFRGTVEDIFEQDVVFNRDGMRWLMTLGDCLNRAFALAPEAVLQD